MDNAIEVLHSKDRRLQGGYRLRFEDLWLVQPMRPADCTQIKGFTTREAALDWIENDKEAYLAKRAELLGSTGKRADVVVPRDLDALAKTGIRSQSGIVAVLRNDRVLMYYEGNLHNAENLRDWSERVLCAAGRMFRNYPTVARICIDPAWFAEHFQVVGSVTDDYALDISDEATAIHAMTLEALVTG